MDSFKELVIIFIATPIYAIAIAIEMVLGHFNQMNLYSWRGLVENILLSLLNIICDILMRGIALVVLLAVYNAYRLNWEPGILYWLALLLAEDFMYYWLHRLDHQCRMLWAIHVTHHSSEEFNLTVGFRSSVFQPMYRFVFFLPLALLGFKPQDILLMYSITQIYGILVHTQLVGTLGILEKFLVTPSHHRVHHASNPKYLDKNLGMVFIIWDRIFGTFVLEDEPVRYGITKPLNNRNGMHLVFHEWKSILKDVSREKSLKGKLQQVFYPPGWRQK
jgi:sterol desaturase/sphingolipid hydroxylase (fatty acid hydroxylase superfamily)